MTQRRTEDDEERKEATIEPSETKAVSSHLVLLGAPKDQEEEEEIPKPNVETRVLIWNGRKEDERPPTIGSMQPPGR